MIVCGSLFWLLFKIGSFSFVFNYKLTCSRRRSDTSEDNIWTPGTLIMTKVGNKSFYFKYRINNNVMLKEIFHDSFENFEITRICMENHASVTGWQKLFFSYKCFQLSAAVAIATFEIYGWKFSGYLILICSFSLW